MGNASRKQVQAILRRTAERLEKAARERKLPPAEMLHDDDASELASACADLNDELSCVARRV
jgi:hypothetical protein